MREFNFRRKPDCFLIDGKSTRGRKAGGKNGDWKNGENRYRRVNHPLNMTEDQKAALHVIAERENTTVSELIRCAIDVLIDEIL